ncbi:hypothetical protein PLICRDRAFT_100395 [Plicaturopsis crispa FD-325 SS-3]|nr:hypothetical protein PLICRDRAFT_100395 [Plicaturopsis crispa FD-325 SS-3]
MPISEIDDIFSKGKGKAKAPPPVASTSALPADHKKKKDKKKKKSQKSDEPAPIDPVQPERKKRPAPETVIDPSTLMPAAAPPPKRAKLDDAAKRKKVTKSASKEEEDRFKDSRGSGPRRKTEEGFAIYKEDELGIVDEGGGMVKYLHAVATRLTVFLRYAVMPV